MENDDRSPWLFGDNLQDKVKSAAAGGKVTKRGGFRGYRGRGRANAHPYGYNPYPMAMPYASYGRGYGYAGYASQASRWRPFLGDLEDIDGITFPNMQDITITQNDFGILPVDKSNQIPCFVYRPEGKPEKEGPEEGLKVVEETEVRRERTGVIGELSNIIYVNKWGL